MLRPISEVYNLITYEPLDDVTRDWVHNWLTNHYPEAEWEVYIRHEGRKFEELCMVPHFSNPKIETFYLLKWGQDNTEV